jgi:pantoate--beta-alanine ligase
VVVIRRLVEDLNLPVRIEALPTVREPDGLAMSSRNALLSAEERHRALAIPAALDAARTRVIAGERAASALVEAGLARLQASGIEPEYLSLVDPDTLEPIDTLTGAGLLVLAARVGDVRLIDNAVLAPQRAPNPRRPLPGKALA